MNIISKLAGGKKRKKRKEPLTGDASTLNPDSPFIHYLVLVGVIGALGAAIVTSWNGLLFVAHTQLLDQSIGWVTPVMIDVSLVVLAVARGALKARRVRARGIIWGIVGLTLYSSIANLLHTVSEYTDGGANPDGLWNYPALLGSATNALAPWVIFALTEVLWIVATKQGKIAEAEVPAAPAAVIAAEAPVAAVRATPSTRRLHMGDEELELVHLSAMEQELRVPSL